MMKKSLKHIIFALTVAIYTFVHAEVFNANLISITPAFKSTMVIQDFQNHVFESEEENVLDTSPQSDQNDDIPLVEEIL